MKARDVKVGYLVRGQQGRALLVTRVRLMSVDHALFMVLYCEGNLSITASLDGEIDIVGV